jgi:hypothetical protein
MMSQISLLDLLDLSQVTCLNEACDHTFKSIVATKSKNTSEGYLLSDADEQLLLNISVASLFCQTMFRVVH